MNWIDARKQQILDEYEKRKLYEDVEERALNTAKDYQRELNSLKKENDKLFDEYNRLSLKYEKELDRGSFGDKNLIKKLENEMEDIKNEVEANYKEALKLYNNAEKLFPDSIITMPRGIIAKIKRSFELYEDVEERILKTQDDYKKELSNLLNECDKIIDGCKAENKQASDKLVKLSDKADSLQKEAEKLGIDTGRIKMLKRKIDRAYSLFDNASMV